MAYICKHDFSIIDKLDKYNRLENDYFECDDLITPTIALLNKKGYKIQFCCSGHPRTMHPLNRFVNDISEVNDITDTVLRVDNTKICHILGTHIPKDKRSCPWIVTYCKQRHKNFYIKFDGIYKFEKLPQGFYVDYNSVDKENTIIRYNFEFSENFGYYDMMTKILRMNMLFYKWVRSLDNLN